MKPHSNILLMIIFSMLLLSCEEKDATPTTPVGDTFDPATATLIKQGMLEGIGHTVSGTVSVYTQNTNGVILLDPFMSQNGPDLKVYLSEDINATKYISLGKLKSTNGKQSYQVPTGVDLSKYKYVHIWCEAFTVVFGRAEVK